MIVTNTIGDVLLDVFFYGKIDIEFFANFDENRYYIIAFCLSWVFLIAYLCSAACLARIASKYTAQIRNQIYKDMLDHLRGVTSAIQKDTLPPESVTQARSSFVVSFRRKTKYKNPNM